MLLCLKSGHRMKDIALIIIHLAIDERFRLAIAAASQNTRRNDDASGRHQKKISVAELAAERTERTGQTLLFEEHDHGYKAT